MIDRESRFVTEAAPDVYPGLGKVAMVEQSRAEGSEAGRSRTLRAFTLIELMVAVGILVLLAGLIIPAISHSYNQAQIQAQQLEFQSIASALENYNKDFGVYPSNSSLPTWATMKMTGPTAPGVDTPAPHFLSLASALLSPGPATPLDSVGLVGSTLVQAGDGADGPGFRATVQSYSTTLSNSVVSGDISVTVSSVPPSWIPPSPVDVQTRNVWALSTITLSPGTSFEEIFSVLYVVPNGPAPNYSSFTINLGKNYNPSGPPFGDIYKVTNPHTKVSPIPPTDAAPILKTASQKVWPSYLPNTMKFQYDDKGQPQLLDHWGGVIQYFTRFGPKVTNRLGPVVGGVAANSSFTPVPAFTPTAGPLVGYCTPVSIENPNYPGAKPLNYDNIPSPNPSNPLGIGFNAIWDRRDAIVNANNQFNSWYPTATVLAINNEPWDPWQAFMWMLGDDDGDNFIGPNETLHYDGPYILISAGQKGILCNFITLPPNPTAQQKLDAFKASGNIYNFSR
jgi:type II secretory pathway pseudopilin PulG